jgi:hypothetical protein
MIDREARQLALNALHRFLNCETDSDEYEAEYPLPVLFGRKESKDRVIQAVYSMSWNWFDDVYPHKLDHECALELEIQQIADRCLLFLASDLEYEWHENNFMQTGYTGSVLTSLNIIQRVPSVVERISNHLDQPEGDAAVWPFFRSADLDLYHIPTAPAQTIAEEAN